MTGRTIALTLLGVFATFWTLGILSGGSGGFLADTDAYWDAALRLRSGQPLYFPGDTADVYRYAPWFAWAWIPLSYLPQSIVYGTWAVVLGVAAVASLWPIRAHPAVLLFGPFALHSVYVGNVQMLMVAGLVWRFGPVSIALAGSLKAAPILFVLVYRREWRKAAMTLALFGILVAPMAWMDYPLGSNPQLSLFGVSPVLWAVVWVTAAGIAFVTTNRLVAATAAVLAMPRLLLYDLTLLLIPARRGSPSRTRQPVRWTIPRPIR